MNKTHLTIILVLGFSVTLIAQDLPKAYMEWKNQPNYNVMVDKEVDLSQILYMENCSYVGIFGLNRQKINLRFHSVEKHSWDHYSVLGASLLKGKQCPFEGHMTIERFELNRIIENELYLVAVGNYAFEESCENGGIFKGVFRIYFHYNGVTKTIFDDNNTDEYNSSRGFAGIWYDSLNKKSYPCHFGVPRLPSEIAGDFDDGGGEPIINPKYRHHGWESHYTPESGDIGYYWPFDCEDTWWEK